MSSLLIKDFKVKRCNGVKSEFPLLTVSVRILVAKGKRGP